MIDSNSDMVLLVSSLQSKVEKLVIEHKKTKEELKQLKEDNFLLRKTLSERKVEISTLEEKIKILKLAKTLDVGTEKSTDLKLKINELVKEIDKCIALVNS
jgi:hypothetical protein